MSSNPDKVLRDKRSEVIRPPVESQGLIQLESKPPLQLESNPSFMSRNTRLPESPEAANPISQPNVRGPDPGTPFPSAPETSSGQLAAEVLGRIGEEIGANDPPSVERSMFKYSRDTTVLGLSVFDPYSVCYDKLLVHLSYLRRSMRDPKIQKILTEEDILAFNGLWEAFADGASKDMNWLQEIWTRRGDKAVSTLWGRLRPIIDNIEDQQIAMAFNDMNQFNDQVRSPSLLPTRDPLSGGYSGAGAWGTFVYPTDNDRAFQNSDDES